MVDVIQNAIDYAKKHNLLKHYYIACNPLDYEEVKSICEKRFPNITVWKPDIGIERGKIYLWDREEAEGWIIQSD